MTEFMAYLCGRPQENRLSGKPAWSHGFTWWYQQQENVSSPCPCEKLSVRPTTGFLSSQVLKGSTVRLKRHLQVCLSCQTESVIQAREKDSSLSRIYDCSTLVWKTENGCYFASVCFQKERVQPFIVTLQNGGKPHQMCVLIWSSHVRLRNHSAISHTRPKRDLCCKLYEARASSPPRRRPICYQP